MDLPLFGIGGIQVAILLGATLVLNAVGGTAYASRHAGVRTGMLATAGTVYGLLALVGRVAGTLQAPLLNKALEQSILAGGGLGEGALRLLLAAAALGTFLTLLLYPSVVAVFEKSTLFLRKAGSAPRLLAHVAKSSLHPVRHLRRLRLVSGFRRMLALARRQPLVFFGTVAVVAVNTSAVYAATLAALWLPDFRATCLSLTAVVNAGATIALSLLIDPRVALETDRAVGGEETEADFGDYASALLLATVMGQILAQLVLVPGALAIAAVARIV